MRVLVHDIIPDKGLFWNHKDLLIVFVMKKVGQIVQEIFFFDVSKMILMGPIVCFFYCKCGLSVCIP